MRDISFLIVNQIGYARSSIAKHFPDVIFLQGINQLKQIFICLSRCLAIAFLTNAMVLFISTNASAETGKFEFGVVGDTPYTRPQESEFPEVIKEMNNANLEFVVHVGDFEYDPRPYNKNPKSSAMPCVEENFKTVRAAFDASKHPFILTPGDNDWTDCHLLKARKVDPLQALKLVRNIFYPSGKSMGQNPMSVISQSANPAYTKFVENLTWSTNGISFGTLHLVGSNNGYGKNTEPTAEFVERAAANTAWLKKIFSDARTNDSLGVVLFTQANPAFEGNWNGRMLRRLFRSLKSLGLKAPKNPKPSRAGYDEFNETLLKELQDYHRPVVLLHGDTHYLQINKPLYNPKTKQIVRNFTRVETFGWPYSGWIHVTVDPDDSDLFSFKPRQYPAIEGK